MPCEYIIFCSAAAGISRPFWKGREENLVFMAVMAMKIYVQQIRRFIYRWILYTFFLIFLINLGLSTLHWKCKHPDGMNQKSFKQHGKCIIAELGALTETGNAIRNILTRNGFSLTHSISPPIFGSASMASVCRKYCDDVGNLFESLKSMSQTTRKLNVVCAHFSWRAH